jgi:hypothetical protein
MAKNFCIDIEGNYNFFKDVANKFNLDINYAAYLLGEYLIENDLTLDDYYSNQDGFVDYIETVKYNNLNKIRANDVDYLLNVFWLKINKVLKGHISDATSDMMSAVIMTAKKYLALYNKAYPENRMNIDEYISNKFDFIIEKVFVFFNDERCYSEQSINAYRNGWEDENGNFNEGSIALTKEVSEGDSAGNARKLLNTRISQIAEQETRVNFLNEMLVTGNWSVLCSIVKKNLADIYGIKIKNKSYENNELENNELVDSENEQLDDLYPEEELPKDRWMTKSEMTSNYKTASASVKLFLSFIPTRQKSILGFDKYYPPRHLYDRILESTYGIKDSGELIERIKNLKIAYENEKKEDITAEYIQSFIIDAITNDDRLKTDFFVAFSRINKDFNSFKFIKKKDGNIQIMSQKLNKVYESEMFEHAYAEQLRTGRKKLTQEEFNKAKELVLQIAGLKNIVVKGVAKSFKDIDFKRKISMISNLYLIFGLINQYNSKEVEDAIFNMVYSKNKLKFTNSFIPAIKSLIQKDDVDNKDYDKIKMNFSAGGDIKNIKEALERSFLVLEEYSNKRKYSRTAKVRNEKGETVTMYCDQLKSFMTQIEQDIQTIAFDDSLDEEEKKEKLNEYFKEKFLDSPFFMRDDKIYNIWIRDIVNDLSFAENFQIRINMGINKKHVKNYGNKDRIKQMLGGFYLDSGEKKNTKFWWCPVMTLGDSESNQSMKVKKYGKYDSEGFNKNEIVDALYDVYQQELERDAMIDRIVNEAKRKGTTPLLPRQFWDKKDKNYKYGKCTFLPFLNGIKNNQEMVKAAISQHLIDIAYEFYNEIKEYGLENEASSMLRGFKAINEIKVDETIGNDNEAIADYNKRLDKAIDKSGIMDFVANYALAECMQQQLFNIDNAYFANTKDLQKRNKGNYANGDSIDTDATDYDGNKLWENPMQKCVYMKEIILNAEDTDLDFMKSIIYQFADDKERAKELINSDDWRNEDKIKNIIGDYFFENVYSKYKKNKVTDGQGYRTLDSYRKICISLGGDKWDENKEQVYKKIKELEDKEDELSQEELTEILNYQAVFQPLKLHGRYNEKMRIEENSDDFYYVPSEHKYAEIVLIPKMLPKNSKIRRIAEFMKRQNIDLACFDTCVKFGSFGEANLQDDNNDIEGALSSAYIHELDVHGLKLQSNVPYHGNADNLFGTQSRKLILNSVSKEKHYSILKNLGFEKIKIAGNKSIDANKLDGKNYFSLYNSLIAAQQLDSYNDFLNQITTNREIDFDKLSKLLIDNGLNNNRTRFEQIFSFLRSNKDLLLSYFEHLNNDSDFVMPLNEGSIQYEAFSLLASIFKNKVNKQKILGGSLVQASAFGFGSITLDNSGGLKTVVENNNVLSVECEIPFDFTVTNHNGRRIQLKYEKYCNENGTLKTYNNGKTKIETDYPGILDIIAYRIPTEREYSMLKLKVVRCSKEIEGGTIKVPQQYTTVAGFDFDIDKLYLMRKEFKTLKPEWEKYVTSKEKWYEVKKDIVDELRSNPETSKYVTNLKHGFEKEFTDQQKIDIWDHIYAENEDLKKALKYERDEANKGLTRRKKNDYLTTYFEKSAYVKRLAIKNGFKDAKEFKHSLFAEMADKLGIIEVVKDITTETKYYTFNEEEILADGLTVQELIKKTAKELGIVFNVNKNEGRYEEYNPEKTMLENTRVSRNNLILEFLKDRLSDPDSSRSRYFPGGFAELKDIAKYFRYINNNPRISYEEFKRLNPKDIDEDEEIINPLTYLKYENQNSIASKLIGMFANHNTNNALTMLMDEMYLTKDDAIRFGKQSKINSIQSFINKDENVTRRIAELLAASVDAVKDPVFSYLNINLTTANVAVTLARLGYDFEDVALLLNQPIIKEICKRISNNDESYLDTVLQEISNELGDKYNNLKNATIDDNFLINNLDSSFDSEEQYQILKLFTKIVSVSKELNSFVQSSKYTASNSFGSNIGEYFEQRFKEKKTKYEKIKMTLTNGITTPIISTENENISQEDYLEKYYNHPFLFEQCAFDCCQKFLQKMNTIFGFDNNIYKPIIDVFDSIAINLNRNMNEDLYNRIIRMIPDVLLSKTDSLFNPNTYISFDGRKIRVSEYYRDEFPYEILSWMSKHIDKVKKYKILDAITHTKFKDLGNQEHTVLKIEYKTYEEEKYSQDMLSESWADMLNDEDEEVRNLARHLFYYSFHIGGTDLNVYSFLNLAPIAVKLNVPVGMDYFYRDFFVDLKNGKLNIDSSFIGKFINDFVKNNIDDSFLTRKVYNEKIQAAIEKRREGNKIRMTLNYENDEDRALIKFLTNEKDKILYAYPVIKVNNTYYKLGEDDNINILVFDGRYNDEGVETEGNKIKKAVVSLTYKKINIPKVSNELLALEGGADRNEENFFINRNEDEEISEKNDSNLNDEDYERAVNFLNDALETLEDIGEEFPEDEMIEMEKLSGKERFKKQVEILNKYYDKSSNILFEAFGLLYSNDELDDNELTAEIKEMRKKCNNFNTFVSNLGSKDSSHSDEEINHLFNGLVKLYRENNDFSVTIDGETINLC